MQYVVYLYQISPCHKSYPEGIVCQWCKGLVQKLNQHFGFIVWNKNNLMKSELYTIYKSTLLVRDYYIASCGQPNSIANKTEKQQKCQFDVYEVFSLLDKHERLQWSIWHILHTIPDPIAMIRCTGSWHVWYQCKQGNSVTRDLPPTGSAANTTPTLGFTEEREWRINSHLLLSGETTFHLTSC